MAEKIVDMLREQISQTDVAAMAAFDSTLAILNPNGDYQNIANILNDCGLDNLMERFTKVTENGFSGTSLYQVGGYIAPFLDMKTNEGYLFNIELPDEERYRKALEATGGGAKDRPSFRFVYGQYALVLEPIMNFQPTYGGFGSGPMGWYLPGGGWFYGTPTNLAELSNSRGKINDLANDNPIRVFGTCMYIDKDVEYFNFGKIEGLGSHAYISNCSDFLTKLSEKDPTKTNFAYGWHVVIPNVIGKNTSRTQTADIPKIPTPHPAPDPGPLPDDSLDDDGKKLPEGEGGPGKIFNIVKYYETWDHEGLQEVQSKEYNARLTRTDNPQTIIIMNEKEWKVEDWYTSPNDEPESRDWKEQDWKSQENRGDTNTYDEQKEKNSTVQYAKPETLTTTVTLKKDEEKTLYVKLVKRLNAPVESDIDLEQSQLTKAIRTNRKNVNNTSYWGNYSFKIQVGPFKQTDV